MDHLNAKSGRASWHYRDGRLFCLCRFVANIPSCRRTTRVLRSHPVASGSIRFRWQIDR
jgi:hypothetical protein